MSSAQLLSKLQKVKIEIDEMMQLINGSAAGIQFKTIDDECEVEYLVDCVVKNVKNLKDIVKCSVPEASSNSSYETKKATENNADVQKLSSDLDRLGEDSDATLSDADSVVFDTGNSNIVHDVSDIEITRNAAVDVDSFLQDVDFDDESFGEMADDVPQNAKETDLPVDEVLSVSSSPSSDDNCADDYISQPQEEKYLNILKKFFGYAKFRPLQWRIISSILNEKRDNCVIMATGYGKSLCYQFPSVVSGKTSVVVSPLISLMEDQVMSLSTVNIPSCLLGSAQHDMIGTKSQLLSGSYRVVYVTPEFIQVDGCQLLRQLDSNVGIDLIAIDEAHCVSQWGHDFRSAYRGLGQIRQYLPNVPIMALTATATPEVRKDICRCLKLQNPVVTCSGFDRPNLYLSVSTKTGDIIKDLRPHISGKGDGPTIIYCPTKKTTEMVAGVVQSMGHQSAVYHAGMSLSSRKQTHHKFINDEIQVIVATVAFGMGIDKRDVRKIIHYGAPRDIESYYQEIGRAGRDGLDSSCHAIYSTADFQINRYFLQDITDQQFLKHKLKMLRKMEYYLQTTSCRRREILTHFEDASKLTDKLMERCCDNCTLRSIVDSTDPESLTGRQGQLLASLADTSMKDFGKEARHLLQAVRVMDGRYGLGMSIQFLRGSVSQRLPVKYQKEPGFGSGKYRSEKWWKAFGGILLSEGYLEETPVVGSFGSTVSLSDDGSMWLRKGADAELMIKLNRELLALENQQAFPELTLKSRIILPSVPVGVWQSSKPAEQKAKTIDPAEEKLQNDLYAKLICLRNTLSSSLGLHTYMIFSNKSLLDMARFRPTTIDNLVSMEEVAEEKAHKYGDSFLECIRDFCLENNWPSDCKTTATNSTASTNNNTFDMSAVQKLHEKVQISYNLFEVEKMPLESVAQNRCVKPGTIVSNLCDCIRVGLPVDIERLGVTEELQQRVIEVIRNPPINSDISRLTPIREQLPDSISFDQIKVVVALLQRRFGVADAGETSLCSVDSRAFGGGSQFASQNNRTTSSTTTASFHQKQPPALGAASTSSKSSTQTKLTSYDSKTEVKRKIPDWMSSASQSSQAKSADLKSKKQKRGFL